MPNDAVDNDDDVNGNADDVGGGSYKQSFVDCKQMECLKWNCEQKITLQRTLSAKMDSI